MTEKEWLENQGFSDHGSFLGSCIVIGTIAAAMLTMKHFSDKAKESRGEPKESWKEWILR